MQAFPRQDVVVIDDGSLLAKDGLNAFAMLIGFDHLANGSPCVRKAVFAMALQASLNRSIVTRSACAWVGFGSGVLQTFLVHKKGGSGDPPQP